MIVPRWLLPLSCLALGACSGLTRYLENRGLDAADCVKLNVGVGYGLTVDAHVTDWVSPALGIRSHVWCVGYEDREILGLWEEELIVNTPRAAWESIYPPDPPVDAPEMLHGSRTGALMLSSLLLANERWIRDPGSGEVSVQFASLFNLGRTGEMLRAGGGGTTMLGEGQRPEQRHLRFWRQGFVELGVTLVAVEARAGVNVFELVDFAVGLVGLDPANDDR